MKPESKTPAQRERARLFALNRGETWFRGARVSKTNRPKAKGRG